MLVDAPVGGPMRLQDGITIASRERPDSDSAKRTQSQRGRGAAADRRRQGAQESLKGPRIWRNMFSNLSQKKECHVGPQSSPIHRARDNKYTAATAAVLTHPSSSPLSPNPSLFWPGAAISNM
eukprot:9491101-Pyramimonas_sp.AAC.2